MKTKPKTKTKPAKRKREKRILAWHWLPSDKKLAHCDGRPVTLGKTMGCRGYYDRTTPKHIELCSTAMHGSIRLLDAMWYADNRQTVLCRVQIWGSVQQQDSKIGGRYRRVIAWIDGKRLLRHMIKKYRLRKRTELYPTTVRSAWQSKHPAWVRPVGTYDRVNTAMEAYALKLMKLK